jgi:hypothetical protein
MSLMEEIDKFKDHPHMLRLLRNFLFDVILKPRTSLPLCINTARDRWLDWKISVFFSAHVWCASPAEAAFTVARVAITQRRTAHIIIGHPSVLEGSGTPQSRLPTLKVYQNNNSRETSTRS